MKEKKQKTIKDFSFTAAELEDFKIKCEIAKEEGEDD